MSPCRPPDSEPWCGTPCCPRCAAAAAVPAPRGAAAASAGGGLPTPLPVAAAEHAVSSGAGQAGAPAGAAGCDSSSATASSQLRSSSESHGSSATASSAGAAALLQGYLLVDSMAALRGGVWWEASRHSAPPDITGSAGNLGGWRRRGPRWPAARHGCGHDTAEGMPAAGRSASLLLQAPPLGKSPRRIGSRLARRAGRRRPANCKPRDTRAERVSVLRSGQLTW